MVNQEYKSQNKKSTKVILVALLILTFIFFFLIFTVSLLNKTNENVALSYEELSTIKQIVEYYKSTYINEVDSKRDNYDLEVYLTFKCLPYEKDDTSNKEYYMDLINDCARVINYSNFIMFDEKNGLEVEIQCEDRTVKKVIINGNDDYFNYMDSQISMKKFKEIKAIEINAEAETLKACISNRWSKKVYFGEKESIFEDYNIYFDEGINVRVIDGKVYNIIYTSRYQGNVVEGIFPGIDIKTAAGILGTPHFEDKEAGVIGYKGENFYIFITNNEISIYRNSYESADDFFNLVDTYLTKKVDLLEFMNQLTYLWPDYSEYTYTSRDVYLVYPLRGVEIRLNSSDISGFLVYNNIRSSMSKIGRYLENTEFISRLQKDLVFEVELQRLNEKNNQIKKCKDYVEGLSEDIRSITGESVNYSYYCEKDSNDSIKTVKFISPFDTKPNRELNDGVYTYIWVSPDCFVYSKRNDGIFFYDLNTGKVTRLLEGNNDFKLKGYSEGVLKYDFVEVSLHF